VGLIDNTVAQNGVGRGQGGSMNEMVARALMTCTRGGTCERPLRRQHGGTVQLLPLMEQSASRATSAW
jgi:hypothetical protein